MGRESDIARPLIIVGAKWHPALMALAIAPLHPGRKISFRLDAEPQYEIEPAILAHISPRIRASLDNSIIRIWPHFVINLCGQIHELPLEIAAVDPNQIVLEARQRFQILDPVRADLHWAVPGSEIVDTRKFASLDLEREPGGQSRWVEWAGVCNMSSPVLADVQKDGANFHHQYFPLTPSLLFTRALGGVDLGALSTAAGQGRLAKEYCRQFPSELSHVDRAVAEYCKALG